MMFLNVRLKNISKSKNDEISTNDRRIRESNVHLRLLYTNENNISGASDRYV